MNKYIGCIAICAAVAISGCKKNSNASDSDQQTQQEVLLKEATAQTGMPAIKNFRERKLLKDILELRDQEGLVTYTYIVSDYSAKLVFFCTSVGYGIPYATQYTSPQKIVDYVPSSHSGYDFGPVPQADPNGLFAPASAEGTWVMCLDDASKKTEVVYVEPRIVVAPFKMDRAADKPVKAEKAP